MILWCCYSGYNPPQFIIDAAKSALDRVECNQYSPTKGRPRLKKAIADAYSPFFGRTLDPETEVTITTGANEGTYVCCLGGCVHESVSARLQKHTFFVASLHSQAYKYPVFLESLGSLVYNPHFTTPGLGLRPPVYVPRSTSPEPEGTPS